MKRNNYNLPDCLSRHNNDINLGIVYSKHRDIPNLPELTTIYEIERPLLIALDNLNGIIVELNDSLSENLIKGLFILGVSSFEVMFSDLLKRILQLHPESLGILKLKNEKEPIYEVTVEDLKNGNIATNLIEKKIDRLCFGDIESIIKKTEKVLSCNFKNNCDKIIEIKETRNLLLHNNLVVNDFYLNKTKGIKRAVKKGQTLPLDVEYVRNSIEYLIEIVMNIRKFVCDRYRGYTILALLERLWDYTFSGSGIPTKIEDYWTLNYEEDIIDGPVKQPENYFGSSERFFFEVWKAQRNGSSVSNFSMVHLDSKNIKKLSFLVEVFGNLSFPYYYKKMP